MATARAKGLAVSVIGVTVLAAALALATWTPLQATVRRSAVLTNAVIDFGRRNDKVTIKLDLDGPDPSQSVGDFSVQVIIVDHRTGARHDTGPQPPTVVR